MIQFTFPSFLLSLLLLMAVAVYLLRRWQRWMFMVFGGCLNLLGLWLWQTPVARDQWLVARMDSWALTTGQGAVPFYGFHLQLTPSNEPVIVALLLLLGTGMMLMVTTGQDESFPMFVLPMGAGYICMALMVDAPLMPVVLAPIFLAMLMAISVFSIQTGYWGDALGLLWVILPPILAVPFILLASWYLAQVSLNPQDTGLAAEAMQLLAVGLLLLLAPVPLHRTQPELSGAAPPIAAALVVLFYQTLVLYVIYLTMTDTALLRDDSVLNLWLIATGIVTAVWGGLAAAGTSHPGRLWGYAMLHDWGLILLLLAGPFAMFPDSEAFGVAHASGRSWPLVVSLFALRIVSTLSAATGMAQLRRATGELRLKSFQGIGTCLPWSTTAFLLGGLGLAGFPLTAGFSGHWAGLQALAEIDWRFAAVVLVSSGGVVVGFVRIVPVFFGQWENPLPKPEHLPGFPQGEATLPREQPLGMLLSVGVVLLVAGIAIMPQLFEGPIIRTLFAFN